MSTTIHRENINAPVLSHAEFASVAPAQVLVCFYGPRGGVRYHAALSLDAAEQLRIDLDAAIAKLRAAV